MCGLRTRAAENLLDNAYAKFGGGGGMGQTKSIIVFPRRCVTGEEVQNWTIIMHASLPHIFCKTR